MSADDKESDGLVQVNALLIEYGLLESPLDLKSLDGGQKKPLSDVLHALIAQRQRDADLRQELVGRNRTLENALERTKKLWKEDGDKCADAERKLEGAKSAANTAQQQCEHANATLKKTRDELHRTRKDLISVKQQAAQQRQANERQIERSRARFTEEAMKSLRTRLPHVELCAGPSSLDKSDRVRDASAVHLLSRLARRQIDELEQRRTELSNDNLALKSLAVDCLNLARSAGSCLEELSREQDASVKTPSKTSHSTRVRSLNQEEMFLPEDNVIGAMESARKALAETSEEVGKSIDALRHGRSTRLWSKGQDIRQRLRESVMEPLQEPKETETEMDIQARRQAETEAEELRCMLDRAIGQIEELEEKIQRQKREMDGILARNSKEMSPQEMQSAVAEVERQRQRYHSLCRALEEQEQAIAHDRQELQRQKEELTLEQSLLATDGSLSAVEPGVVTETVNDDESNSSNVTLTSAACQPQSRLMPQRFASTPRTRILPLLSAPAAFQTSSGASLAKRPMTEDKENVAKTLAPSSADAEEPGTAAKRQRTASATSDKTGTHVIGGSEMRFITMRKNRGAR